MANTTNYGLTKPTVGTTGWGENVNTNFDTIDTQMKANADAIAGLTTASVPDSLNKRYVTDAKLTVLNNTSGTNTGDQTLPTDATIVTTDVTTNNASASKHGWLPKLENTGTKYLKDDGTWATVSAVAALDDLTDVTITSVEQGDILYRNGSGWVNLHHGTDGQVLTTKGNGANPEWATPSAASVTRGTFVNADLSTGVLTVTHNKGLSAPYSLIVQVFNNSAQMIIPDQVTGLTNTFTIDLTSYGTLTGTWGYSYIA